jgi:GTP-binding protein HflX
VPEQIVFNKIDVADPDMLQRLRRLAPDAVFVSARTGAGVDKLQAVLEDRLPRPAVEVTVLLPYARGDLVDRVHRTGEVLSTRHIGGGTLLNARVTQELAAVLRPFTQPVGVTS